MPRTAPNHRRRRRGALAVLVALCAPPLAAQQQPPAAPDSLRLEVQRLAALVDSLRAEVARLQAAGVTAAPAQAQEQDALAKLRAAAAAAASAGGGGVKPPAEKAAEPQEFVGRQRSLQALNPEISVTGDLFGQVIKGRTNHEDFFAREFEIAIQSNLDPFSRAKIFITRHAPGGEITPFDTGLSGEEGTALNVEEGYMEWVKLPLNLGLKVGLFHQQFGMLNRWHSHAYPFQSRDLPNLAFFGEEPLAGTGLSLHYLAPFGGGGAGTYEATVEVTRSQNELLWGTSDRPSVLVNLNGFWQLSASSDLNVALTRVNASYEDVDNLFDRVVYGGEVAFTWRPPSRASYRGFNFHGGVKVVDGLVALDGTRSPGGKDQAKGYWTMAELRLGYSWLAGARYDWTENPHDPKQTSTLLAPTLTWWQSEFVRVRAEYDLLGRSFMDGHDGRLFLQVTFSMGPHKHETY
jgi:hypothetical protein